MTVHVKCPFCHTRATVVCSKDGYNDWREGELIQNALPELSVDTRELLMTGICNECFPS